MSDVTGSKGTESKSTLATTSYSVSNHEEFKKVSGKIADKLESAEQKLMKAYEKGDQKEISQAQIEYDKWNRVWTAFSNMLRNAHEMMMTVIRNMRLN